MNILQKTKHGIFCINNSDNYQYFITKNYGEYFENQLEIYKKYAKKKDFIIEVGSCYGLFTIPLSYTLGAKGKIIAFEPQREIFYNLCANISLNNVKNIEPVNFGVGSETKSLNIPNISDENFDYYISNNIKDITGSQNLYQSTIVKLDDFPVSKLNLLLVNIDSCDDVIAGCKKTIMQHRPLIFTNSYCKFFENMYYEHVCHTISAYQENNWFSNKHDIEIKKELHVFKPKNHYATN